MCLGRLQLTGTIKALGYSFCLQDNQQGARWYCVVVVVAAGTECVTQGKGKHTQAWLRVCVWGGGSWLWRWSLSLGLWGGMW